MNTTLNKIASILAFLIGAMAIFAGAKPLLGANPDYYVINWLPLYNYTIGVLTVFLTAILIWANSKIAMPAAIAPHRSAPRRLCTCTRSGLVARISLASLNAIPGSASPPIGKG